MDPRNQQIQHILHQISRIETELALLKQLVAHLARDNTEEDQDLILVNAELIGEETDSGTAHEPQEPRPLTRRQLLQDGRWRAQNWALSELGPLSEREASGRR
jgi:hypothetical protein